MSRKRNEGPGCGPASIAKPGTVLYARVSSKDQEKEGFSIPAQLELLRSYAAANGFTIVQEFVDVETAKQGGRISFSQMITLLKKQTTCRTISSRRRIGFIATSATGSPSTNSEPRFTS